jgi:hypothetical protein
VKTKITMRRSLEDPALLGGILAGPSWAAWRVILIAAMGEALSDGERETFRRLTGRDTEPGERVDELWACIGRRGGKSRAAAVLIAYIAALVDHADNLAVGESGVVLFIAENQRQAGVVFGYVEGIFGAVPMLSDLVAGRTSDTLTLKSGIDLEIRAADFRGLRGPTYIAVVVDEAAFLALEGAVNADAEILAAVRPGLATTGGPLIVPSSPYGKRGEFYQTYKRHYGPGGDPRILVVQGESRDFNPTLSQAVIDRAMDRDPVAASSEYGAKFRSDVSGWADLALIESAVERGIVVRPPPGRGRIVHTGVDVSGGVRDSFTAAGAHLEADQTVVLDFVLEIRAPFNPTSATKQVADTLKSYGVNKTTGDRYSANWSVAAFAQHGIKLEHSERDRSAIYLDCLPLFTTGRARLLDNPRLVAQFAGLERKTSPIGKDRIDHGPRGADDLCNSAALAMVLAASNAKRPMRISDAVLQAASNPNNFTTRNQGVFFR